MITVYAKDATDFANNGLGTLEPITCKVNETLNGAYEVVLVHPYDEAGKWMRLVNGCILRVPVPRSMTPYVELADRDITVDKVSRGVWRAVSNCKVRILPGAAFKVSAEIKAGEKAAVMGTTYEILLTETATGKVTRSTSSSYPTEPAPTGYTRTVNTWYRVCANGHNGYTPAGGLSNVYYSQDVQTIIGETVESRQLREQPFRIYRTVPELDKITVYARHIYYDLADNMVLSYTAGQNAIAADAVKGLLSGCVSGHDFTAYSDLDADAAGFKAEGRNPVDALMGDEGVLAKYGGELSRDWWDVFCVKRVGSDTQITIREGKNLLGVVYDENWEQAVSRIIPRGETSAGKALYLPEIYIESENAQAYPHPRYAILDVENAKVGTDGVTQNTAYTNMRAAAQAEYEKGADLPTATLTVDFINCADTEEYRQYGFLQNIYLGDTVRVISERTGISVSMRMTQYTYDCMLEKYELMMLGSVAETMETSVISAGQLPTGIITGSKLALGSVGAGALLDGAVRSAKIDMLAVTTAHIAEGAITTAKISDAAITSAKIGSAQITSAHIADGQITTAHIGTAGIDYAVIKAAAIGSATAESLIARDAVTDRYYIDKLQVHSAQLAQATVGDLVIKAADNKYYKLSIDSQGQLSASEVTLTSGEISAGVTSDGKSAIIETDLTAADLSATNLKAINALIDKLEASRINVDELFARTAFINKLVAADISSNTSLQMYVSGNAYEKQSGITIDSSGISLITGKTLTIQSGNFSVDASGNVSLTGTVNASAGEIGGWTLGQNVLYSGSSAAYVGLSSSSQGTYALWAGNETASSAPFRVARDGTVTLTALKVLNEQQQETTVDLRSYPLWKLYYNTIKSVGTNSITLSDNTVVNFNTAASVTLSGSWSGFTFTVSASHAGISPVSVTFTASPSPTGTAGTPISGQFNSSHRMGISLSASNISGAPFMYWLIDASDVYLDGVAAGENEFTLTSVTLQGSGVTAYPSAAGGTVYYTRGAACYVRGSAVTEQLYRMTGEGYVPVGETLYHAHATYTGQVYMCGSSSISVGSAQTLYTAGQTVSDTYYTKS